jgi:hypothetical protein
LPRPGLSAAILGGSLVGLVLLGGIAYLTLGPDVRPETRVAQAASVPIPSPPPPLEVAAVQATADAVFTRTPGALIPTTPTPPPKPVAQAKVPPPVEATKPAGPTATVTRTVTATPIGTPTPEPTEPPTRTPTTSPTPTVTVTYTPTQTPTPLPAPCDAKTTVPRLAPGNGFFVVFAHEVPGEITVLWPTAGGRVVLYAEPPPEVEVAGKSGEYTGFPSQRAIAQGTSGPTALNLPGREPGTYAAYFFNPSASGVGPDDAVIHYWTYGHCP